MSRAAALRLCLAAALPVAAAPVLPAALAAQTSPAVRDAQAAFDGFDFPRALALGRTALTADLNDADRATAYEIVGFSLGALDSTDKALTALEQFIVLDPDRLPAADILGPRLVDLYTQARALVLVVRRPRVDSAEFVAGQGEVRIHYEVSRPAVVTTTVIGPGVHAMIDSSLVNPGAAIVSWDARQADSTPVPAGTYQIVVSAFESHDQYQALGRLTIEHAPVDTLLHLTDIAGLDTLPTMERPPRDWRPLGLSVVLTGLAGGLALALDNSGIGGGHRELFAGGALSLGVGLVLSLRRPDLRPVPANIRYNEQVKRLLEERNRQISAQNAQRRREVLLRVAEQRP
jgi:hypothetical protein